ncbi:MAG: DUF1732 domain-containing protein [Bacteroidales bacterium]|nr:DUF1732 domain-containing protein [Bacteroidales bacterium]
MRLILLSGGSGKRLWPLSNEARSKQFLPLLQGPDGNRESMVQRVLRQASEAGLGNDIVLATNASQKDIIQNQLGENIETVLEPERRDTFPAIALAVSYLAKVERYEKERVAAIRERIDARIKELALQPDANRIEQEMIFWLEKLDINEEKVRLRQHCSYFRETVLNEPMPGRKLGYIAQEMGREINTLGSKANHAEIQKCVVRMKDELEKFKEQTLNIL